MKSTQTLKKLTLLAMLLIGATQGARTQTYYVITYTSGSTINYLSHTSSNTLTNVTTFDPQSCLWTIDGSNNIQATGNSTYYLRHDKSALSLYQTNDKTSWNDATSSPYYSGGGTNKYLVFSSSTWQINETNSYRATTYSVTTNSVSAATTVTTPTISPSSVELDYNNSQTFTASATASTTPSYTTYSFNGNTFYYYNSTIYSSESDMTSASAWTSAVTNPTITYTWTLSGSANTYLSKSDDGATTVITHSTQASEDVSSTLSVTATANGESQSSTSDATVTASAPKVDPTSLTVTTPMTVYVGQTGTIAYTLTPSPCYTNLTYSSASTAIATVSSGVVTGVAVGQTTVTVTAYKLNGTTDANLTGTVTVTVKDKVVAPVITYDPTPGDDGATATATITCSTPGVTIYYTTDGSTPTASSTEYTAPFTVNDGDEVRAIAIKTPANANWDNSDVNAQTYVSCSTVNPTITYTQSGSSATVTIKAETGATIYYTTDGSDPTTSTITSGTGSVTIPGVAGGATVKAIAKNGSCQTSSIVSKEIIVTGVSGGVVTLYDYEDHNWTYYSGVPSTVDGGNYNTNYLGKLYSPNPRNVKITYKANGGAVSIDESETTFVYYKTLEESTTSGKYNYQVISNPFSKRPNGKGFGGWKIIRGGAFIQGHSNNETLALDAAIVFENLDDSVAYTVNCTSAEIVFEATWVNLNNITYASGNTFTYNVSGGNYETNILVLNRDVTGTITTTSPVTIMMVEPDGSTDYRGTYTFTGNITPNNTGITKIEFTRWNSSNTLDCNNHSVTVGRGMTTTSQCANYVTGVTGSANNYGATTYSSNLSYHLKLESGTFTDVAFIAGTEGSAGYVTCNGTSNQVKGTLGNDYDRAKGDNTKLTVTDELFLGYRPTYASGNQNNANFTCWVKSGNMGSSINVTNTTFDYNDKPNGGYYGDASQTFYVSVGGTQTYIGKRKLYVEGGILAGIAGGIDANNNATDETFFIRMTGGTVRGVVYGSGAFAAASGIRRFVITGGTINGWVAAGCNGTDPTQSGGTLPSDTYVYIGGTTHIGNATDLTLNTSSDGNVFGAGSGNSAQATTGQVNNSNVVIADQCYVKKNVYGGGNYGYSNATATVYVTGGRVANSVFGGSNQKQGVTVNVNMTGGQVDNGVYGGSNQSGNISGAVNVKIYGGTVNGGVYGCNNAGGAPQSTVNVDVYGTDAQPASGYAINQVFGGGNQANYSGTPQVTVHCGTDATTPISIGEVYGGGNQATVTGTNVTIEAGNKIGDVYGGGRQAAVGTGGTSVTVTGGTIGRVFGGNNLSGTIASGNAGKISVTVDKTGSCPMIVGEVYGGGNQAASQVGSITIGCTGTLVSPLAEGQRYGYDQEGIGAVYGGANKADINGDITLDIVSGIVDSVFGGNNNGGTIDGDIAVTINKSSSATCDWYVGRVYGGGNKAAYSQKTADHPTVEVKAGLVTYDVYGGGKGASATVTGNPTVTLSGTANINGSVYGGGEAAPVVGNTSVRLKN